MLWGLKLNKLIEFGLRLVPAIQKSFFFKFSIVCDILFTVIIGIKLIAPLEVLETIALSTFAELFLGKIIASTLKQSAVLIMAPKFCGSVIPSKIKIKAFFLGLIVNKIFEKDVYLSQ